jgi:hypothetical protein
LKPCRNWCKIKGGDKEEEKKKVVDIKSKVFLVHTLHHHVKRINIFEIPYWKAAFDGLIASHALPKQCGAIHNCTRQQVFLKIILIHYNYINILEQPQNSQ